MLNRKLVLFLKLNCNLKDDFTERARKFSHSTAFLSSQLSGIMEDNLLSVIQTVDTCVGLVNIIKSYF